MEKQNICLSHNFPTWKWLVRDLDTGPQSTTTRETDLEIGETVGK